MWGLHRKLTLLHKDLKQWNRDTFGNIFDAVSQAEAAVKSAEVQYDADPTDIARSLYHKSIAELKIAQNRAFLFWKQKANVKWLKEGDTNASFFHQTVKDKRC